MGIKQRYIILFLLLFLAFYAKAEKLHVEFLGDTINIEAPNNIQIEFADTLSDEAINNFYNNLNNTDYQPLILQLTAIKSKLNLSDWLFYQLVRHTAQQISPKKDNYNRYTLYKWFLLSKSGFDATVSFSPSHLLLYVKSEDNIYGIPFFEKNNHQYICLNIHDYGQIDFEKETVIGTTVLVPEGQCSFSYKITQMPDFKQSEYNEKELEFSYQDKIYHFSVKLNPEIKTLFINYPVADFGTYFNIPLSKETYGSLIPALKKNIEKMNKEQGIDYLMRFTRYAFMYETDQKNFGKEKRLSPEQTLLYEHSDCDDRAALFFYLVKEIYNMPMIALLYPTHITIAVHLDKPVGRQVVFNGKGYSICDPTPQQEDLAIGEMSKKMKHTSYEVVYEYNPTMK